MQDIITADIAVAAMGNVNIKEDIAATGNVTAIVTKDVERAGAQIDDVGDNDAYNRVYRNSRLAVPVARAWNLLPPVLYEHMECAAKLSDDEKWDIGDGDVDDLLPEVPDEIQAPRVPPPTPVISAEDAMYTAKQQKKRPSAMSKLSSWLGMHKPDDPVGDTKARPRISRRALGGGDTPTPVASTSAIPHLDIGPPSPPLEYEPTCDMEQCINHPFNEDTRPGLPDDLPYSYPLDDEIRFRRWMGYEEALPTDKPDKGKQRATWDSPSYLDPKRPMYSLTSAAYTRFQHDIKSYGHQGYARIKSGDKLGRDQYIALSLIGAGHYATVWLAWSVQAQRHVAIKVARSAYAYHEAAQKELYMHEHFREKPKAPGLEYLVTYLDTFEHPALYEGQTHMCIVMEADGMSMSEMLRQNDFQGLPLRLVKRMTKQMLQGLQFLHRRDYIHTDIKPDNILLAMPHTRMKNQMLARYVVDSCLDNHRQVQAELAKNAGQPPPTAIPLSSKNKHAEVEYPHYDVPRVNPLVADVSWALKAKHKMTISRADEVQAVIDHPNAPWYPKLVYTTPTSTDAIRPPAANVWRILHHHIPAPSSPIQHVHEFTRLPSVSCCLPEDRKQSPKGPLSALPAHVQQNDQKPTASSADMDRNDSGVHMSSDGVTRSPTVPKSKPLLGITTSISQSSVESNNRDSLASSTNSQQRKLSSSTGSEGQTTVSSSSSEDDDDLQSGSLHMRARRKSPPCTSPPQSQCRPSYSTVSQPIVYESPVHPCGGSLLAVTGDFPSETSTAAHPNGMLGSIEQCRLKTSRQTSYVAGLNLLAVERGMEEEVELPANRFETLAPIKLSEARPPIPDMCKCELRPLPKVSTKSPLSMDPKDVNIKIADLGNARRLEYEPDFRKLEERQTANRKVCTLQYRPPESLLGAQYGKPIDVWAMGCTVFELLTGDLLFQPVPDNSHRNRWNKDHDMVAQHIDVLGPYPAELIKAGADSWRHFDDEGNLSVLRSRSRPLLEMLTIAYRMPQDQAIDFCRFLGRMLELDQDKRATVEELLNDPWLNIDEDKDDLLLHRPHPIYTQPLHVTGNPKYPRAKRVHAEPSVTKRRVQTFHHCQEMVAAHAQWLGP